MQKWGKCHALVSAYRRKKAWIIDSPTKEELDDTAHLEASQKKPFILTMECYDIHNHIITQLQNELPTDS
jgi:hypothetical protein